MFYILSEIDVEIKYDFMPLIQIDEHLLKWRVLAGSLGIAVIQPYMVVAANKR